MSSSMYPKAPTAEVGDIVLWYAGGETTQTPVAAIVTSVGYDSLNLNVFQPQSYNQQVKDGVRHVNDKRAKVAELQEAGGWDFTPQHKRLAVMHQQFELLHKELKGK